MSTNSVKVRNITLEGGKPSVCSPLTGKNETELLEEVQAILDKKPDVIEWRADFFTDIADSDAVVQTASRLREKLEDIPILFTIRSVNEGGQDIGMDEPVKVELLKTICKTECIDLIDYEIGNDEKDIKELKQASQKHNVKLVLSFHNFTETPSEQDMLKKLQQAASYGADIGKLAVMPQMMSDVLAVLQVTQTANQELHIPIITMSMGTDGGLTRLVGWKFGSAMTFAVGSKSSAPGQIPIEVVRQLEGYLTYDN
ncbi:type I 3-dehydroquinate dehydratase [Salibacterium salarium]|uniref:3-dehydroquinate dehydratase n=1 Tax=Salibacterium salarium TaxID=284579 RepID=A0A3R9QK37_9BACI|nr:type I 3-dehydroquinate dehydratase [Salibacterium salarium]RSL32160.1 type I 3-dehydroquinate dehydratase [Salibacterium salarium]